MEMLEGLIADGRIAWGIALLMVAEVGALAVYRRVTGGGVPLLQLLTNTGAGLSLVLALYAALSGAGAAAIGGALFLSLIAHVFDLATRWERGSPRSEGANSCP